MYIFILIFFFINCGEKEKTYIINPTDIHLSYKTNFKALNPGEEKYSLLLSWSKYPNEPTNPQIDYNIITVPIVSANSISTYDTIYDMSNLTPGMFYSITMQISPQLKDSLVSFTKPVNMVNWITNEIGNYGVYPSFDSSENHLVWETIIDADIDSLFIYSYNSSSNYPINTSQNSWEKIAELSVDVTEYIHQKITFTNSYCYTISSSDEFGNTRNSYISCEDGYLPQIPSQTINIQSISSEYTDRILINLEPYIDTDFNSYILWRSLENTMSNTMKIKIAESTQALQVIIDDRNNVTDRSFYYQVETINQYGVSSFGNVANGITLP